MSGHGKHFGPVELHVISMSSARPSSALLNALAKQLEAKAVRLLDFVVISKSPSGDVSFEEIDMDEFQLGEIAPIMPGLASEEDLHALATHVANGESAALIALEMAWARELSEQLESEGNFVIATERIPAPVVNALVDLAQQN